jgi:hypothetical protein
MTAPSQHPQTEYIITEKQLQRMEFNGGCAATVVREESIEVRSRPYTPARNDDVLNELREKYVEFMNHPCPELAEKYNHGCDAEYCGLCILDEVLEQLRQQQGEQR